MTSTFIASGVASSVYLSNITILKFHLIRLFARELELMIGCNDLKFIWHHVRTNLLDVEEVHCICLFGQVEQPFTIG
jgi:hypothetical protein